MKKTYIFDMDGVLVDTEPIYLTIHKSYFHSLNVLMTDEDIHKLTGLTSKRIYTDAKLKYNLPDSVEDLVNRELVIIEEHFGKIPDLQPITGILTVLEKLKSQNTKIGLASSNTRNIVNLLTERTGIAPYFDITVSGDEVKEGKPSPEIFLKAAELLGEKPENCLVIEDSYNGVKAAKAAGMYCIGFRNPNSGNQDLSAADLLIDNFEQLLAL